MNSIYSSKKSHLLRRALLALGLVAGAVGGASVVLAEDQMPNPNPDVSLSKTPNPHLVLEIKFAADGHVKSCRAIEKSSSPQLDKFTIDFIKKNWDVPSHAGHTAHQPIDYQPAAIAAQPATNAPAETKPAASFGTAFNGGMSGGNSSSNSSGSHDPH